MYTASFFHLHIVRLIVENTHAHTIGKCIADSLQIQRSHTCQPSLCIDSVMPAEWLSMGTFYMRHQPHYSDDRVCHVVLSASFFFYGPLSYSTRQGMWLIEYNQWGHSCSPKMLCIALVVTHNMKSTKVQNPRR